MYTFYKQKIHVPSKLDVEDSKKAFLQISNKFLFLVFL